MTGALWATIALVGGTLMPGEGPSVENATVIIKDGRVVAAGAHVTVPADAERLDVTGRVITPGLIDPFSRLGLVEISGVHPSKDHDAGGDPIRAAHRAVDAYNPFSAVIPVQRAHGVTTVHSAPTGGLIAGQGAVFSLGEGEVGRVPIQPSAALVVRLGGLPKGSRGMALTRLREALDDARRYAADTRAFERNQMRTLSVSRLDLEALVPVIQGERLMIIQVHRRADIRAALALAREQKLKIALAGADEAWLDAPALAEAKVPVILDPLSNLPRDLDRLAATEAAAARLVAAGVTVAFSTFSAHDVRMLRQRAGNAVRAGLPHADALAAITRVPAAMLGLNDRGRVVQGAVADLVVWSGDPFELSTRVERLYIAGRATPITHRQRALFKRYRRLPPVPLERPASTRR